MEDRLLHNILELENKLKKVQKKLDIAMQGLTYISTNSDTYKVASKTLDEIDNIQGEIMIYIIFASLAVGIFALKFAKKLQLEEAFRRRKKERKIAWNKKQKGIRNGKKVRKRNKPPKRKRQ